MTTNLSTQIVIDDDDGSCALLEYELNPKLRPADALKRAFTAIHDPVRPPPPTLMIGRMSSEAARPVAVEDSISAPESSLVRYLSKILSFLMFGSFTF